MMSYVTGRNRWLLLSVASILALLLLLMQTNTFYRVIFQKFSCQGPNCSRKNGTIHWVSSPKTQAPDYCVGKACVVPRIVHVIWFSPNDPEFNFVYMVSILSIKQFIKPRRIIFWHDEEPTGTWWKFIRNHIPNLEMIKMDPPSEIFGNKIHLPEHKSDVARLQILLRYGGIYLDLDTIVLKSFEPLMSYPVSMGAESPDLLGNGIIVARPNATFLRVWYNNYHTFDDRAYNEHSVKLPMALARKYPSIIHIEWDSLLRPNWFERQWLIGDGKLWDWINNYTVHLYLKYHKLKYNPQNIKFLNTTTGEVLRFIYYGTYEMFKIRPTGQINAE